MIAPDHDRRLDLALLHEIVHRQPELRAFAMSKPADARRQSLELDALARQFNPAPQDSVLRKQLQHEIISHGNIGSLARQRHPAEWPSSLAKQRAYVSGNEPRKIVRILHATLERVCPNIVAVIERYGTHLLQPQHALNVPRHGIQRLFFVSLRIALA